MASPARSAAMAVVMMAVVAIMVSSPYQVAALGTPEAPPAPAYKNHTVGGTAGWFFNATSNSTSGNYSSWATGETFYLGDYLIFKMNDNSSVVHTTNSTTYTLCDASEDDGTETFIYGGDGGGGGGLEETDVVAVALIFEGENYFFSEADGGAQCEKGMHFEIKVAYGRGLPPALAHPPPAPKGHVLAPPPARSSMNPGSVGASASDSTGSAEMGGKNSGCRVGSVGGRFLGVAFGVVLVGLLSF